MVTQPRQSQRQVLPWCFSGRELERPHVAGPMHKTTGVWVATFSTGESQREPVLSRSLAAAGHCNSERERVFPPRVHRDAPGPQLHFQPGVSGTPLKPSREFSFMGTTTVGFISCLGPKSPCLTHMVCIWVSPGCFNQARSESPGSVY